MSLFEGGRVKSSNYNGQLGQMSVYGRSGSTSRLCRWGVGNKEKGVGGSGVGWNIGCV